MPDRGIGGCLVLCRAVRIDLHPGGRSICAHGFYDRRRGDGTYIDYNPFDH